jgi:histone deacetylase 6
MLGDTVDFTIPPRINIPPAQQRKFNSLSTTKQSSMAAADACSYAASMITQSESINTGVCVVRPPGHHSSKDKQEGFCYRNNVVSAAHKFLVDNPTKNVVVVDLDIHHANGTATEIRRYEKKNPGRMALLDVHMNEVGIYPYCSHVNTKLPIVQIPLKFSNGKLSVSDMLYILTVLLPLIVKKLDPSLVLISMGLDTHRDDPFGKALWTLSSHEYFEIAVVIHNAFPGKKLLVLEGGYDIGCIQESLYWTIKGFCNPFTTGQKIPAVTVHVKRLVDETARQLN